MFFVGIADRAMNRLSRHFPFFERNHFFFMFPKHFVVIVVGYQFLALLIIIEHEK